MVNKFEFEKAYEEIEVAGKQYRLKIDDNSLNEHRRKINEFYIETQKIGNIDATKLTEEEQAELINKSRDLVKDMVEQLLGKGSFEPLYKDAGESTYNMLEFIDFVITLVNKKYEKKLKEKREKYTKHKKNIQRQKHYNHNNNQRKRK